MEVMGPVVWEVVVLFYTSVLQSKPFGYEDGTCGLYFYCIDASYFFDSTSVVTRKGVLFGISHMIWT